MTAQLKPCPFCGGTSISSGYNEYHAVVSICDNCNAAGPPAEETSKEAIIAAWNIRACAPELVALVEAAKEAEQIVHKSFVAATMEAVNAGPSHPLSAQYDKWRIRCATSEGNLRAAISAWEAMGK